MSAFDTSDSVSVVKQTPPQQDGPKDYRFVTVDKPVPCTICKLKFATRAEQIDHYHSEEHITKLQKKTTQSEVNVFKKEPTENLEEVVVDLDDSQQRVSQISSVEGLEFHCGCCDQRFKTENALHAHIQTKKHRRNAANDVGEVPHHHHVEHHAPTEEKIE